MAKQNVALPSVASILALTVYDRERGELLWPDTHRRYPGRIAGFVDSHGYRIVRLEGHNRKVHRLIWLLERGEPVPEQIDHINCVRTDNRIENLRPATDGQQQWNRPIQRNNTSGFKGVRLDWRGKWVAFICHEWHNRYIGTFATAEEAHAAYCAEAERLKGEFSRAG